MTQQAELMNSINKLPPQYFKEVIDFVGYLQHKALNLATEFPAHGDKPIEFTAEEAPKGRSFGCSKGKYHITEAFFEPLEDFREYM